MVTRNTVYCFKIAGTLSIIDVILCEIQLFYKQLHSSRHNLPIEIWIHIIPTLRLKIISNSSASKSEVLNIIDVKHILHHRPLILEIKKIMVVAVKILFEVV